LNRQAEPSASSPFRIERVTSSVYAAIARPAAKLNCNAAVIVGSEHTVVVDSHSKPLAARALIAQIQAEITRRPVRYVINSHFHWDHAHGNSAYPQAYGAGVEIISSTATKELMSREGPSRLQQSIAAIPEQIETLRARLTDTEEPAQRESLAERMVELEAYSAEMSDCDLALPTITFDGSMVLCAGERPVHLLCPGRGHTAGDLIVYLPDERVLVTGDLLHGILPYIGDGYPDEWPSTLSRAAELDFNLVVPGHGSVQVGRDILTFFRNYVEEINEGVVRGLQRGAELPELQAVLTPDCLRSLASDGHGPRIEREIERVFGEMWISDSPLKYGVATNIAEIYDFHLNRGKDSFRPSPGMSATLTTGRLSS
jgi:glyoxylase-like metal-dependent hydrolase (beta-lactamase superfamily II)